MDGVDARVVAADGAVGVRLDGDRLERHVAGVVQDEPAVERLAVPEHELDGLGRLHAPHGAGQHAEHAGLGTARDRPLRRRLREDTTVARAVLGRLERRYLSLEPQDCAVAERDAGERAGVVDEVARGEVVRAVDHDVVVRDEVLDVRRGQADLVRLDVDVGVLPGDEVARGLDLRAADVRVAVDHLSLEVRALDDVVVDDAERADAGRREVLDGRRPEAIRKEFKKSGPESLPGIDIGE